MIVKLNKMDFEKNTSKGLKPGHYAAEALILYCVDHRGKEALDWFISRNKLSYYDLVLIPGGARAVISQNEAEKSTVLGYVKKLVELHHAKRIILATHADCGACGGSSAFDNDLVKERNAHGQWLSAAKNLLAEKFPNAAVEKYFVDFAGFWQIP